MRNAIGVSERAPFTRGLIRSIALPLMTSMVPHRIISFAALQTQSRKFSQPLAALQTEPLLIPTSRSNICFMRKQTPPIRRPTAPARQKLLDAALALIREKGYASTTVDELCGRAGVAKGSFFHHFKDKEALAVAAADYWSEMTGALFEGGAYHKHKDPFDRVLGYIDFRKSILRGEVAEFTCLVGTMVQEVYESNPAIRDACDASISGHAAKVEADIAEAMKLYRIRANWTAKSLALHTQAVLQGAFVLAKAKGGAEIAAASIDHLHRYIELLFEPAKRRGKEIS